MDIPVIAMITRSGWVAKSIMILLTAFSVVSWAVIFDRYLFLGRMRKLNAAVRRFFEKEGTICGLERLDKSFEQCSFGKMSRLYCHEYDLLQRSLKQQTNRAEQGHSILQQITLIADRMTVAAEHIIATFDRGLIILAITATAAPFLGLLGTVWGIMNSFFEIGRQGSASLPVVAPGLAEALITTIFGLFVAIPAVIFYNVLVHQTEREENDLDTFNQYLLVTFKQESFENQQSTPTLPKRRDT
ncbi:MAG: MotA/TolQ/ExbB proton channel family protein [Chitinivibrionales bacterium]|nr:MotA/TolQ/ExbB proton channel family protein [Chitinivibrionales bacterium]